MALSITSNYTGIAALDFIAPALLNATTLKNNYITIHTNIKYKFNLLLADTDNIIQADGCSFNAQGTLTLTEKVLQPIHLKVNWEACKNTLESHWLSGQMTAGQLNSDFPKTFKDFLTKRAQDYVAQGIEKLIWQGKVSGSTGIYATFPYMKSFDGLYTLAKASASTVKVTGTTVTSSNASTEIAKVFNAIPDIIWDKTNEGDEVKIFVPRQILRAYQAGLPATYAANSNFNVTEKQSTYFLGVELVPVGLADNTMVAGLKSDLHFGTDLVGDFMEYKMIDMSLTDGSDNVRVKMRFSADVEITNDAQIVVYGA